MNLRERAHIALQQHRNSPSRQNSLSSEPSTPLDDEDELAILGGKTRLVPKKEKSASPQIPDRSPTTQNPIVPLPLSNSDQAVHPYVLEYLRTFVPSQGAQVSQAQAQAQACPLTTLLCTLVLPWPALTTVVAASACPSRLCCCHRRRCRCSSILSWLTVLVCSTVVA